MKVRDLITKLYEMARGYLVNYGWTTSSYRDVRQEANPMGRWTAVRIGKYGIPFLCTRDCKGKV